MRTLRFQTRMGGGEGGAGGGSVCVCGGGGSEFPGSGCSTENRYLKNKSSKQRDVAKLTKTNPVLYHLWAIERVVKRAMSDGCA